MFLADNEIYFEPKYQPDRFMEIIMSGKDLLENQNMCLLRKVRFVDF